jgi:glycosyltransferase involved in cell wall biosynthesis
MKIWIDGYEANVPQLVGSGKVALELLKQIEKLDKKNDYTILIPNTPLNSLPAERIGWKYRILKPKRLWTRIALPLALFTAKQRPNLFFSPTHYIPRFTSVKTIATIFDLSYLHFPEMFNRDDLWKLKNWTKYSIENSKHIITISKFSKKDIIENYHINANKITVAFPGYDKNIFRKLDDKDEVKKLKQKYNISKNYIIYISTIQPRKNLSRLIEAFVKIDDLVLLVVGKTTGQGKKGWKYQEILDLPQKLGIEEKIIFAGYVPSEELPYLINGAVAFVQPSLYEGWGIPVAESMACGVPVIVSNVSSLPEVVGKAGLFVDPYSVTQIEQAIRTISTDKKLHAKLSKESLLQAKKFSWDKMAKQVLKVFEEVGS